MLGIEIVLLTGAVALAGCKSSADQTASLRRSVAIDPDFTVESKHIGADTMTGDELGIAVDVDGDTFVVGAPGNGSDGVGAGAAYVFVRDGAGWAFQQRLAPTDAAAGRGFGAAVALDGDTVVVGAPGSASNTGAAYVFVRVGTVWAQQDKLTAGADSALGDEFGAAVAVDGETALIGSPLDDDFGDASGSAYAFVRAGAVWSEQDKLTPFVGVASQELGRAVALYGETALLGAPGDAENGTNAGAAFVFTRVNGIWSERAKLTASDGEAWDELGLAVALDGGTSYIAARGDDDVDEDAGAVYVFNGSDALWGEGDKITASDGASYDAFGSSVDAVGEVLIVGASADDDAGDSSGGAYAFHRVGSSWIEQGKLVAGDGTAQDRFGVTVAVSAGVFLVGAHHADDAGAAYSYRSDADLDTFPDDADNCPPNSNIQQIDTDHDGFGNACDGDDDGDGIEDSIDNCPLVANDTQQDGDGDGIGNVCDFDTDGDGIPDNVDNCPSASNAEQSNVDGDDDGDACDVDDDGDGINDSSDNCDLVANADQSNMDLDEFGDVCDDDLDGDSDLNDADNCPYVENPAQNDSDADGVGDACDMDVDGDGVPDSVDNCDDTANPNQSDVDGDGAGDACDDDADDDGTGNPADNCPLVPNPEQEDADGDDIGDACSDDMDGDGIRNLLDNCPAVPNQEQGDSDGDGVGDDCDPRDSIGDGCSVGIGAGRGAPGTLLFVALFLGHAISRRRRRARTPQ